MPISRPFYLQNGAELDQIALSKTAFFLTQHSSLMLAQKNKKVQFFMKPKIKSLCWNMQQTQALHSRSEKTREELK